MKILVTGADGQLGYDMVHRLETLNLPCHGTTRQELDITDCGAVEAYFSHFNPDVVIHCAAYTAVDRAQDDQVSCFLTNVSATECIARLCEKSGAKLVYISTDYVFDGSADRPYEVTDTPSPVNYYGLSKYEGECAVKKYTERYFIIRVSWLFGSHGQNFVTTMLSLAKEREQLSIVCDQIGSPTYTQDVAILVSDMINTEKYGIYHVTNEGYCSRYEFARDIMQMANCDIKLNKLQTAGYPTRAKRPLNSMLSKKSLDEAGFARLPHYRDALQRYLVSINLLEST